ncbi:MAG: amidohydrolase family protein [Candidatus Aminicenantes bacterium]|nr:amidohydrolase family protein [Candidatus Aminicenantes bacterium]
MRFPNKKLKFKPCRLVLLLALAAVFVFFLKLRARADVKPAYAFVNCQVVMAPGQIIEKGKIIVRDGLIEAVGPVEKIPVPPDAEIIEASGLTAYPGLISAHTNLFLEVKEQPQPQRPEDYYRSFLQPSEPQEFPDLLVLKELKPKLKTVQAYHKAGITTVVVAPNRGIFQGQSVVLNLNGENLNPMVIKQPWALHLNFTTERGHYPSSLMGTVAFIRQKFYDTQYYAQHWKKYLFSPAGLKRPEYDPFLEALVPFVMDKKPVVFQCNNQEDIKRALKIIKEFNLNGILTGANEAWRVIEAIKQSGIPLMVSLDFKAPATSLYAQQGEVARKKAENELYPANAAVLQKENVNFALTSFGLTDSSFLKNLQLAIKRGLSPETALRALTVEPAKILGLDKQLGTIEKGKMANLIFTRGPLFEDKTKVIKVMVDGLLFNYEEKSQ